MKRGLMALLVLAAMGGCASEAQIANKRHVEAQEYLARREGRLVDVRVSGNRYERYSNHTSRYARHHH